nr:hypothetical protein [Micromonospora sp. DSM 115978]
MGLAKNDDDPYTPEDDRRLADSMQEAYDRDALAAERRIRRLEREAVEEDQS